MNKYLTFSFVDENLRKSSSWSRRLQKAMATYHEATGSDPAAIVVHPKLRQEIEQAEDNIGVSLSVSTCPGIPVWELWLEVADALPKGDSA